MMDLIMQFGVPIVTGIIGGGAVGPLLKNAAMGMLPKLLAGGVGGLGGAAALAGPLATMVSGGDPTAGFDIGSLVGGAVGGGAGGAVLIGIVGTVMGAMNKS
ncbi:MAG: hypothetical protein AAF035_07305 [Pseudomonadota bacterium]